MNVIFYVLRMGMLRRDFPERYEPYTTAHTPWVLQVGWAELAGGITDQAYVNEAILARTKKESRSLVRRASSPAVISLVSRKLVTV